MPQELYELVRNKWNEGRFQLPDRHMLDDVRPYPRDEDFSFRDDDDLVLDEDKQNGKPGGEEEGAKKAAEEASGRGSLDESRIPVDDTDFAYKPTDPRYFANAPYLGTLHLLLLLPCDTPIRLSTHISP